jgi:3-oxoacyl-[acyl-carrier protein] reductase
MDGMVVQRNAVSLDGRVAVVTGGGEGIGRGIAAGLAEFGARVAIWERNPATAERAAAEVGGLSCVTDVRDAEQVDAALATTIDALGVPTILVNNAGGTFTSALLDTAPKGWDTLLRSNLTHVLLCTQRVARAMVDAGVGGSIINVTSIEGTRAAPGFAAYAAAKAGVVNLTQTSALELAPYGIRVNGLAPDVTLTEAMVALAPPGLETRVSHTVPMGRAGHVDEMAGAAVFLASALASYVTGQTLHVDGGTSAAGGWYHHPDDGRYILGPR